MTRPQTIYHVTFLLPRGEQEMVIEKLHEQGVCQIEIDMSRNETSEELTHLQTLHRNVLELHQMLDPYATKKKQQQTFHTSMNALSQVVDKQHAHTNELIKTLSTAEEKIRENEQVIRQLKRFPDVTPQVFSKGTITNTVIGLLPTDRLEAYRQDEGEGRLIITSEITKDLLFACEIMVDDKESILEQDVEFTPLDVPETTRTPSQEIKKLLQENKKLKLRHMKTLKELEQTATILTPQLTIAQHLLEDHITKKQANTQFTNGTYHLSAQAWVPEKQFDHFNKVLEQEATTHLISKVEREDAPTLLSNNSYVKPFEEITRLYSVPKYNRFDPTIIIAIFFPLIFGIMYSDAVYGLLIAGVGLMMTFMPSMRQNIEYRHFSRILLTCGLFTLLMGAVAGSYFGNFAEQIGLNLPKAIDLMTDIIPLVVISLSIGLVHLSIGLFAGFHERVRLGKINEAIKEQGVWIIFIIGALLAIIFPNMLLQPALGLMGVGILIKAGYAYKEQGLISAILSIFDVSKLAGDLASYVRIMALAIGTSGIALAVNVMAQIATEHIPAVGIVIAVLIFIVGHLFNIFISGLGAFIHTLRLHFLEHFGRYYEGGGEEYEPFRKKITTSTLNTN
ncbi:MAG: V-type ATP synthase subunit I [Nanobdellota archaeon]